MATSDDERAGFPRWVPWVLVALPVASIPWYVPAGVVRPFVLGMPIWAFVSLLACVAFAATTSYVILRYWHDPDRDSE